MIVSLITVVLVFAWERLDGRILLSRWKVNSTFPPVEMQRCAINFVVVGI
jgi:hypothetical protein